MKKVKKFLAILITVALVITACTVGFVASAEDCGVDIETYDGVWSNGATSYPTLIEGQSYTYTGKIKYIFCEGGSQYSDGELEGTIIKYSLVNLDDDDALLPAGRQMSLGGEPVSGQEYSYTINVTDGDLPAGNYELIIDTRWIECDYHGNGENVRSYIPFKVVAPTSSGALPAEDIGTYGAYHVSCYSAQLRFTFANGIHKYVDEVGFYIGTSPDNLTQVREAGSFHPETVWYTTSEWGVDLEPSTTYYYKMYYVLSADGMTYECPLKSFTTLAHTEGSWQTVAEATCISEGKQIKQCTECNKIMDTKTIPNNDKHNDGVWKVDFEATAEHDGQMSRYCTLCNTVLEQKTFGLHDHTEGYTAVIRNASCTEDGLSGTFCSICGACYETSAILAEGHGTTVSVTTIAPSCTQAGETTDYCIDCGLAISTTEIEALGHDSGVWTSSKDATCEAGGEEVCNCTRCGETIDSRTTEALGHDDGVWKVDFEATADHDGQMSKYCTRCDMVLESKSFTLHTHTYGHTETLIPAGCLTKGESGKVCATCGVVYETVEIAELDHAYSAWSKNNDSTHSRTCTRCHVVETNNCSYSDTITLPTCTEGGYTTHNCDVCTFSYVDEYTQALGHDWSGWVECEDDCCHERECLREGCDATEEADHNWSEWVYNEDGKLLCNGTKTRVCFDCGASETEEAHHTSWICQIFYPAIVFIGNIVHKIIYTISLDWIFPHITIRPEF